MNSLSGGLAVPIRAIARRSPTALRVVAGAACLAAALPPGALRAQSAADSSADAAVSRVEVRPAETDAPGGTPVRFTAVVFDDAGRPVPSAAVTWFADSYQQVTVDSTGLAIGREVGLVRIGAAAGGKVGTGLLRVTHLPVERLEVALPGGLDRLATGQSVRLEVEGVTALGTRAAVGTGVLEHVALRFSSSEPAVVEVSGLGRVTARRPGAAVVSVRDADGGARGEVRIEVEESAVASLAFEGWTRARRPGGGAAAGSADPEAVRTGDVLRLRLAVRDRAGRGLDGVPVVLGVSAPGASAWMEPDGPRFVAEDPGIYTIVASAGGVTAQTDVRVEERVSGVEVYAVGRAPVAHTRSTDFAMFRGMDGRDYLIQGTIPASPQLGARTAIGDRYYVWDVTEPARPVLTDSILVNARRASDPRVEPGGRWAVLTHEGDPERKNGVTFVDLSTPAHPKVVSRFTDRLTGGVHNTWIDGHHVFAVSNGPNTMVILDGSDPANPRIAGEFGLSEGWRRNLHDIWVEDGLAYLSYWLDGLVVVDVGNGMAGGSVEKPVQVSQLLYDMEPLYGPGHIAGTHTAWREGDYVFVGDEVFPWHYQDQPLPPSPRGRIHVVDVSDLANPRIVAHYEVPEAGSHCVWVEDGKLYVANYQAGLRVVDVTGELRGDLYRQGRELARFDTSAPLGQGVIPFKADAWGIQLYRGKIFVADSNSGTWILGLREKAEETPEPLELM
jgi:hypothetical protein